jgi:hypothetical protein
MSEASNRRSVRFKVAYNPGVGGVVTPVSEVKAHVRDYFAEMDDVEDDEIEVIVSRNVPPDDRYWVFNIDLITDLSGDLVLR